MIRNKCSDIIVQEELAAKYAGNGGRNPTDGQRAASPKKEFPPLHIFVKMNRLTREEGRSECVCYKNIRNIQIFGEVIWLIANRIWSTKKQPFR